ncbi:MAG: DMT family transporter, partial [Anaerolineaceae bacterium]
MDTPSNQETMHFSPRWMMLISVLAVSSGAVLVRYAQQEAPSLMIAAWRLTIGTLVMAPAALLHHRQALRQMTRREWGLVVLSGVLLALHFGTWISSLEYTTVASSVVLVSMSPLLVALLSTFVLKEPLSKIAWAGMAIALAGSVVVALGGQNAGAAGAAQYPNRLLGNVLAFSGAVFV